MFLLLSLQTKTKVIFLLGRKSPKFRKFPLFPGMLHKRILMG